MDFVYITPREIREILSEMRPYQRFKITEDIFNKNFMDFNRMTEIKVNEQESGQLENEFDFP